MKTVKRFCLLILPPPSRCQVSGKHPAPPGGVSATGLRSIALCSSITVSAGPSSART